MNVIEKHKKWLIALQNERNEAIIQREEELKLKEESRRKVSKYYEILIQNKYFTLIYYLELSSLMLLKQRIVVM
jgi:hypothetical protein